MPRYDLRESSYDGPRLVRTVEATAIDVEQRTETEETLALLRYAALVLQTAPGSLDCKVLARQLLAQEARLAKATGLK